MDSGDAFMRGHSEFSNVIRCQVIRRQGSWFLTS